MGPRLFVVDTHLFDATGFVQITTLFQRIMLKTVRIVSYSRLRPWNRATSSSFFFPFFFRASASVLVHMSEWWATIGQPFAEVRGISRCCLVHVVVYSLHGK